MLWYHWGMDDKITIIEGPTPQFIHVDEDWAKGVCEGPTRYSYMLTHLRTFNGPALVERCYRAWKSNGVMVLEYRDELGMTTETPIMAARTTESPDGQVLQLWLRMDETAEAELEEDEGDDSED